MGAARVSRPLVAGAYFLHFAAVGVAMPFLPAHFRGLDFAGFEIGLLLALAPAMTLFVPPRWGRLADRWGRPERVLAVVLWGAAACFLPLAFATTPLTAGLFLAAHAVFSCAVTSLMDSLALEAIGPSGSFARVRLFGSLGFVVSSSIAGLVTERVGPATILGAGVLLFLSAAYSLHLARASRGPTVHARISRTLPRGPHLLRSPELRTLLLACALHWVAGAPYHGAFAIHVGALGLPPWVVGLSFALGVLAETFVMALYPRLRARWSERAILVLAFGATILRWLGMAFAAQPHALITLSLLHGLTFGAFYAAAIAWTARLVPPERRAEGQSMFASVTFGLGGLVGYVLSGLGYDGVGGHGLFAIATGVEVVGLAVLLRVPRK